MSSGSETSPGESEKRTPSSLNDSTAAPSDPANGMGIRVDDLRNPNSLGVLGMQERARLLGGEVLISRQSGGGTIVTVLIPKKLGHEASL